MNPIQAVNSLASSFQRPNPIQESRTMSPNRATTGFNDALILSALSAGSRYGLEVIDRTGLSSGTVYPALRRLEALGLVVADWEAEERAHGEGRPARRYYRLTGSGEAALSEAVSRIHAQQRALGWADGRE